MTGQIFGRSVHRYVLNARGVPAIEPDLLKWARWLESANRHVAKDKVGEYEVSTVFLGWDCNYGAAGPPILWETMVFALGKDLDGEMDRCSGSREDAQAMHARMVEKVKAGARVCDPQPAPTPPERSNAGEPKR